LKSEHVNTAIVQFTPPRQTRHSAISREFRVALPWELLYADDLAVIAEIEEELIKRLNRPKWKDNVESKGKVMISGERQKARQKAVRWPCGVCCKGVDDDDQSEIIFFDPKTTNICWFKCVGVAGRRLVAQPEGLTSGFAVHLVISLNASQNLKYSKQVATAVQLFPITLSTECRWRVVRK